MQFRGLNSGLLHAKYASSLLQYLLDPVANEKFYFFHVMHKQEYILETAIYEVENFVQIGSFPCSVEN